MSTSTVFFIKKKKKLVKTGLHVQEGHGSVLMFLSDTHIIMQKQQNITQTWTIMKKRKKNKSKLENHSQFITSYILVKYTKYKVMANEKN